MTTDCDGCGDPVDDLDKCDVFNESGAVIVWVCSDCREKLTSSRCVACGDRVRDDREESIGPHGSGSSFGRLCPDCRRDLIFEEGGVFQ
ncbi:hypothetical protein ACFQL1_01450 [Halomicroarcula sp. GCM10025709]|uniref:hypothetical protein n=1 Tax=Halomicroarcula sp. GCM10025709 TaxID=3252669 RepID=UPI00360DB4AB